MSDLLPRMNLLISWADRMHKFQNGASEDDTVWLSRKKTLCEAVQRITELERELRISTEAHHLLMMRLAPPIKPEVT